MKTIQGPAIFLAQFMGDEAPFNSLDTVCQWAAGLGYEGVQIPTWDSRLIDLKKAADVLIVSKCPPDLTLEQKHAMIDQLKPLEHQQVFFTHYTYTDPYYIFNAGYKKPLDRDTDLQLLSAIAGTDYLMGYLTPRVATVTSQEYADHHHFSEDDLREIRAQYIRIQSPNKIILTTEKDAMRLEAHREFIQKEDLPIFVLPIKVEFLFNEGQKFDQMIQNYLLNFKV